MSTPDRFPASSAESSRALSHQTLLSEQDLVGLNFKVPRGLRASFRQAAAARDCSMVELLRDCFQAWQEREGMSSPGAGGRQ